MHHRFSQKTKEQLFFVCFFAFHGKQTNSFVQFLEESTAHPYCFWFYLTFIKVKVVCSFFGIIEDTKMFFRNKMTFRSSFLKDSIKRFRDLQLEHSKEIRISIKQYQRSEYLLKEERPNFRHVRCSI